MRKKKYLGIKAWGGFRGYVKCPDRLGFRSGDVFSFSVRNSDLLVITDYNRLISINQGRRSVNFGMNISHCLGLRRRP